MPAITTRGTTASITRFHTATPARQRTQLLHALPLPYDPREQRADRRVLTRDLATARHRHTAALARITLTTGTASQATARELARLWGATCDTLEQTLDALTRHETDLARAMPMPHPSLALAEDGITIHGIPYARAAASDQIPAAAAIVLATHPGATTLKISDPAILCDHRGDIDPAAIDAAIDTAAEHDVHLRIHTRDAFDPAALATAILDAATSHDRQAIADGHRITITPLA